MCAGALIHARVQRLVFASRDFKAGAAGSAINVLNGAASNHAVHIDEGPMEHACTLLLTQFFSKVRTKKHLKSP
jgi:tRNA(adenine34) deaminase